MSIARRLQDPLAELVKIDPKAIGVGQYQHDLGESKLAKSLDAVPNWRPRTDQWNAVETILGTNLNAALAGTATPEAAVQKAADAIRTLMKGAGY